MKKYLWSLSLILMLLLASCGSSSDEAKELLKRILNLIGIPQSIVVNLCQDKNRDGVCNALELQAKVSIKQTKGDTLTDIWAKITNTADGKYLLETYDPTLPLLLELQDSDSQYYANKFTVPFTGLKTTEEEKDLSLLQAMVDAGYLTSNQISSVAEMKNQDEFYAILLKDFETNLKTLEEQNLSSPRAVLANLQEVATELKDAGIDANLTNEIDSCGNDDTCIDETLEETIINDEESVEIKDRETQSTKELLAGKTFYIAYNENGTDTINKLIFNDAVSSITWEIILGNKDSGTESVQIDGNKLIFTDDTDGSYTLISQENGYIFGDDRFEDGSKDGIGTKFYTSQSDAEAALRNSGTGSDDFKFSINNVSGKTFITIKEKDNGQPSGCWTFNEDKTLDAIFKKDGIYTKFHSSNANWHIVENDKLTFITEGSNYQIWEITGKSTDLYIFTNKWYDANGSLDDTDTRRIKEVETCPLSELVND